MWRKGSPFALLVGMQIGAATVESSIDLPQKLKMELPFDSTILLLGIYLKKPEILKYIHIPIFTAVLFTIAKTWKQPNYPPVNEWIKMLWYIYTIEYLSAVKKNKILAFETGYLDLKVILLSKISQIRERLILYDFIYMWNIMNKITNKIETNS